MTCIRFLQYFRPKRTSFDLNHAWTQASENNYYCNVHELSTNFFVFVFFFFFEN